mgnify:CR=1 FL=1
MTYAVILDRSLLDTLRTIALVILVTMSMVSGSVGFVAGAAGSTDTVNTCEMVTYDGSGTTSDPYEVSTAAQLQCIENRGLDSSYILTSDINLDGAFDPIGNDSTPFTGEFDGAGHTIADLYVSRSSAENTGLFGVSEGRIENITLTNVTVTGSNNVGALAGDQTGNIVTVSASGTVSGGDNVGGLVGQYDGTSNIDMTGSSASVDVTGNTNVGGLVGYSKNAEQSITYSSASGDVTGDHNVGGLIGLADYSGGTTNIYRTNASGDIKATGSQGNVGGLVGKSAAGRIQQSYATGNVTGDRRVGGLVGVQKDNGAGYNAAVVNSYANGTVDGGSKTGGLVGRSNGVVRTSYATGEVIGATTVGGLIGDNDARVAESRWDIQATGLSSGAGEGAVASSTTGLRTSAMQDHNAYANMSNFDFLKEWAIRTNDYPVLAWQGVPPLVYQVEATNPSKQNISVSFKSTRALTNISVSLSGPSTLQRFSTYEFAVARESYRGPMTYTLDSPVEVGSDGAYTFSVNTASVDSLSNGRPLDGADGQSATITLSPSGPDANAGASPPTAEVGEEVTLTGSNSTDPDGSITTYEWDVTGEGSTDATDETITRVFKDPGTHEVTLTVTDSGGNTDTDTVAVEVISSASPKAKATASPSTVQVGEDVTLTGTNSTDPDGSITKYEWDVTGEGSIDATNETITRAFKDPGSHEVTLTVTDSSGNTDTVTVTVKVVSSSSLVANATVSPMSAEVGERVILTGSNSTDPDGSITKYEWDVTGEGSIDATNETITRVFKDPGTHEVTLTVTDEDGNTDTDIVIVEVASGQPAATINVSPSPVEVGERVTLTGSNSTDPDGSITKYEWDVTGEGSIDSTDETITRVFKDPGTHVVALTITDNDGNTDTDTMAVEVTSSSSLEAKATASPSTVKVGEDVILTGSDSNDQDGSITKYEWDVTGEGSIDATNETITRAFKRPGTHEVTLTVTDEEGNTDTDTTTVEVASGPPVANISLSSSVVEVGERVTLTGSNSTDPDGSITKYEWDVTGEGSIDATEETITRVFKESGTHTVTLTITDSGGNTDTIQRQVTVVEQTAPTVSLTAINGNNSAVTPPVGQTIHTNGTATFDVAANGTTDDVSMTTVTLESTFTNFDHVIETVHQGSETWTATEDLSKLPDDGTYQVVVAATDSAGDRNETVTNVTVRLDRRNPELAATVSQVDGDTGSVNVTASEPLAEPPTIEVRKPDGTTETAQITAVGDVHWNGTFSLSDTGGQYEITVIGTDEADNEGTSTATAHVGSVETENNSATVVLELSGLFVNFTTDQPVTDTVVATGSETPLAPVASGNVSAGFLHAELGDHIEGNLSYAVIGIPVNMSAVPASVDKDDVGIRYYNTTTETWKEQATTIETRTIDGTTGQYWVANVSHFSTYGAVASDNEVPTLTQTTPSGELSSNLSSTTIKFAYADAVSSIDVGAVEFKFDGTDVTSATNTSITSQSATYYVSSLDAGSHTATVTVQDQAGNVESYDTSFTVPTESDDDGEPERDPDNGNDGDVDEDTDAETNNGTDGSAGDDELDVPTIGEPIMERLDGPGTATIELPADSEISVLQVELQSSGTVEATAVKDIPANKTQPTGETLGVLDIEVKDTSSNSVPVRLTVPPSAVSQTGASPSDLVIVHRHDDGTWANLETTVISKGTDQLTVEATATNFSLYAVTVQKQQSPTTTTTPTTTERSTATTVDHSTTSTSESTASSTTSRTPIDDTPDERASSFDWSLIGSLMLLCVLIGAIVVFRFQRS